MTYAGPVATGIQKGWSTYTLCTQCCHYTEWFLLSFLQPNVHVNSSTTDGLVRKQFSEKSPSTTIYQVSDDDKSKEPINHLANICTVNREISFVQSIISAGIVHTVTKNCSTGDSDECKCSSANENKEEATRNGFRWAGCSDNTELGYQVAIAYLDKHESGHDFKAKTRLHNNEAGRNVSDQVPIV